MRAKLGPPDQGALNGLYESDERRGSLAGMKKLLVIAAAGGALALGVPAALAATDSPDPAPAAVTTQPVQQQERPDRDDCPEKDRRSEGASAGAEI